jgi:hypothetical protein
MQFNINIVPDEGCARVPLSAAGNIMVGIQSLYSRIGGYIVAKELRIQGDVPPALDERFKLYLDSSGGITISSSSKVPGVTGHGSVTDDALSMMGSLLEAAGSGAGGYWIDDNYSAPHHRTAIAGDLMRISETLRSGGCTLVFGEEDRPVRFSGSDTDRLRRYIKDCSRTVPGATSGILERTDTRSKKTMYHLGNGSGRVRVVFSGNRAERAADGLLGNVPAVVSGMLAYSGDGRLAEIKDAEEPSRLETMKFRRMIGPNGDVRLSVPAVAEISYVRDGWRFSSGALGISVTKKDWDSAVTAFHDYFMFLWETYAAAAGEGLGDEEKEVRSELLRLVSAEDV